MIKGWGINPSPHSNPVQGVHQYSLTGKGKMARKFKEVPFTHQHLQSILTYSPDTGQFHWLVDQGSGKHAGDVAGKRDKVGRNFIFIEGRRYPASRLAWFYHYGYWPGQSEVDHADRNPANDKISNLRLTSRAYNLINRRLKARALPRGVYKVGKRFRAQVKVDGVAVSAGTYATPYEAYGAWLTAMGARAEFLPKLTMLGELPSLAPDLEGDHLVTVGVILLDLPNPLAEVSQVLLENGLWAKCEA